MPNAKDELTQKPPNTLNLLKLGSAFAVSSILLLAPFNGMDYFFICFL
jgi:hypothetical protein